MLENLVVRWSSFRVLFATHIGTMLITAALMVFYIVHVFKNPVLGDKRVLWAVVLFMGNAIAMPIYSVFVRLARSPLGVCASERRLTWRCSGLAALAFARAARFARSARR